MRRRKSLNYLEMIDGELYVNENDDKNYWNKKISVLEFVSSNKKEFLKRVNKCIDDVEENHNRTSESLVDILLNNHQIFINIGKYVDRLDKNIQKTVEAKNQYCNIIQNLSKDVTCFSEEYQKTLKNTKIEENIRSIQRNNSIFAKNSLIRRSYIQTQIIESEANFDDEENANMEKEEFIIEEFLKPKKGSKNWLKEQSEIIYNLIHENKITEAAALIREIKNFNFSSINYETKLEIDKVFNYLIEHLNNTLIKALNPKDVLGIINLLRELGHAPKAMNSYLLWISKNLNRGLSKAISYINDQSYEEDLFVNKEKLFDKDEAFDSSESANKEKKIIGESLIPDILHMEQDNFAKKFTAKVLNLNINNNSNSVEAALSEKNKLFFKKGNSEINLIVNKNANNVIYLYEFFFDCMEKYLDSLEKIFQTINYFKEPSDNANHDIKSFNSKIKSLNSLQSKAIRENLPLFNMTSQYVILPSWLRSEVNHLAIKSEILFLNITSITELNLILTYMKKAYVYFENKGFSARYIFDDCFISNLQLALKSIFYFSLKNKKETFAIQKYLVAAARQHIIRMDFYCIGEISELFKSVLEFLNFLIAQRLEKADILIHIIFVEQFFLDQIFLKSFFSSLVKPLKEVDSYNYSIKAISNKIYLDKIGIPIPNEILINWGISLFEIFRILKSLKNEIYAMKKLFSVIYIETIDKAVEIFRFIKKDFFAKLFKSCVEIHFFHAFANLKESEAFENLAITAQKMKFILSVEADLLAEHQKVFFDYFTFLKALARNIKQKLFKEIDKMLYDKFIRFVFVKSLFENFKQVILSLKDLNAEYNLDFCFKELNIQGFETIVLGVYFVYNAIHFGFDIDETKKNKDNLDAFVEKLINEYFESYKDQNQSKQDISERKSFYYENTKDCIKNNIKYFKNEDEF